MDRGDFNDPSLEPAWTDADLAFLARYTGEHDLDSLREHVRGVYRDTKAQLHVFRCIQRGEFLKPRLRLLPCYPLVLETLASDAPPGVLLDVGTCFGQDVRGLLLDGVTVDRIVAVDLHDGEQPKSRLAHTHTHVPQATGSKGSRCSATLKRCRIWACAGAT